MRYTKLVLMAVLTMAVTACGSKGDDNVTQGGYGTGGGGYSNGGYGTSGGGYSNGAGGQDSSISSSNLAVSSLTYFKETIGDRVLFNVDQTTLNPASQAILDSQTIWMIDNPNVSVRIEGHADEQGTREYNLALGARRASAVSQYLVSKGIPSSRIITLTYGKERPISICSIESCYSKNRRAVTIVTGGLNG